MKLPFQAHSRTALAFLLLILCSQWSTAQNPAITATAKPEPPDRTTIWLHESLSVRLTVEGPAPLRVELPQTLLAEDSFKTWEVRPAQPPRLQKLDGNREQWSQVFRLSPYPPGGPIAFAPITVNGQAVTVPPLEIKVQATVTDVRPETARPVTGVEDLPPRPPDEPGWVAWAIAAGAAVVFVAVLVLGLVRRARAKPKPLPPLEWALAEFDRLDRSATMGEELAERLAAVLREFVARKFGILAPKLTTTELLAETEQANWPAESVTELRELLERCDRAKFAADAPSADENRTLVSRARAWVSSLNPPPNAGGQ